MDISVIKASETSEKLGIKIGNNSDKVLLEFLNLRCPYCKQWFETYHDLLNEAVATEKIQRVIKLVDRPKESLQRGNVMHQYVTTGDGKQALTDISRIFQTQDQWAHLSLEEVAAFAQNKLGLKQHNHLDYAEQIVAETERANIKFVPTIIIDEHIFDESIDEETLKNYLN